MDGNNDDDSDTDLAGYRVPCLVLLRGKSPLANELVDWVVSPQCTLPLMERPACQLTIEGTGHS